MVRQQLKLRLKRGGTIDFKISPVKCSPFAGVGADSCPECDFVHLIMAPRQVFKPIGGGSEEALFTDPLGLFCSLELSKAEAIALAEKLLTAAGEAVTVLKINAPAPAGRS